MLDTALGTSCLRDGSPSGGSSLITVAPRSDKTLPQKAPAVPPHHSRTRSPLRGAVIGGFSDMWPDECPPQPLPDGECAGPNGVSRTPRSFPYLLHATHGILDDPAVVVEHHGGSGIGLVRGPLG